MSAIVRGPRLAFPLESLMALDLLTPTVSITEWILGSETGLLKNSSLCNEGCKETGGVSKKNNKND